MAGAEGGKEDAGDADRFSDLRLSDSHINRKNFYINDLLVFSVLLTITHFSGTLKSEVLK